MSKRVPDSSVVSTEDVMREVEGAVKRIVMQSGLESRKAAAVVQADLKHTDKGTFRGATVSKEVLKFRMKKARGGGSLPSEAVWKQNLKEVLTNKVSQGVKRRFCVSRRLY